MATEKLFLLGDDDKNTVEIRGTVSEIYPSPGSACTCKNPIASNKIKIKPAVKFFWEYQYYIGKLICRHRFSPLLAYCVDNKNPTAGKSGSSSSMVRIRNTETTQRLLLKSFCGRLVTMEFAMKTEPTLAVLDSSQTLHVFEIEPESGSEELLSAKLLLVLKPDNAPSPTESQSLSWCPWSPNSELAVPVRNSSSVLSPAHDPSMLLAISYENKAEVIDVALASKLLREQYPECSPTERDKSETRAGVTSGWKHEQLVSALGDKPATQLCYTWMQNHSANITGVAISRDASCMASGGLDGKVFIYALIGKKDDTNANQSVPIHVFSPHDGLPVYGLIFIDDGPGANLSRTWSHLITGAQYNRELRVWQCTNWNSVQTIRFCSDGGQRSTSDANDVDSSGLATNAKTSIVMSLDWSSSLLVASDITRRVFYVLELVWRASPSLSSAAGDVPGAPSTVRIASISEFLLTTPCILFALGDCERKNDLQPDPLSTALYPNVHSFDQIKLEIHSINTWHLLDGTLAFELPHWSEDEPRDNVETCEPPHAAALPLPIQSPGTSVSDLSDLTRVSSNFTSSSLTPFQSHDISDLPCDFSTRLLRCRTRKSEMQHASQIDQAANERTSTESGCDKAQQQDEGQSVSEREDSPTPACKSQEESAHVTDSADEMPPCRPSDFAARPMSSPEPLVDQPHPVSYTEAPEIDRLADILPNTFTGPESHGDEPKTGTDSFACLAATILGEGDNKLFGAAACPDAGTGTATDRLADRIPGGAGLEGSLPQEDDNSDEMHPDLIFLENLAPNVIELLSTGAKQATAPTPDLTKSPKVTNAGDSTTTPSAPVLADLTEIPLSPVVEKLSDDNRDSQLEAKVNIKPNESESTVPSTIDLRQQVDFHLNALDTSSLNDAAVRLMGMKSNRSEANWSTMSTYSSSPPSIAHDRVTMAGVSSSELEQVQLPDRSEDGETVMEMLKFLVTESERRSNQMKLVLDKLQKTEKHIETITKKQSDLLKQFNSMRATSQLVGVGRDTQSVDKITEAQKTSETPVKSSGAKEKSTKKAGTPEDTKIPAWGKQILSQVRSQQGDFARRFANLESLVNTANSNANELKLICRSAPPPKLPMPFPNESSRIDQLPRLTSELIRPIVQFEIQNAFTNNALNLVAPLQDTLLRAIKEGLSALPTALAENISRLLREKNFATQIAKNLSSGLTNDLSSAYRDALHRVFVPALEKNLNRLFQELNSVFHHGTEQYLQQLGNRINPIPDSSALASSIVNHLAPKIKELVSSFVCSPDLLDKQLSETSKSSHISRIQSAGTMYTTNSDFPAIQSPSTKSAGKIRTVCSSKSLSERADSRVPSTSNPSAAVVEPPASKPENSLLNKKEEFARLLGQAQALIRADRLVEALELALISTNQALVLDVCNDVDPAKLFGSGKYKIGQNVILSLIHQLSCGDMSVQIDLKLSYLQEAVLSLDKNDPTTVEHGPRIVNLLSRRLETFLNNATNGAIPGLPKPNPSLQCRINKLNRSAKLMFHSDPAK
ncbi:unnamed protein product [Calicophoron daubneyi]|uniref:Enhancer of mRNA-decapping protein 4 n=1 Tax=Calicophoron daubneyi TaxID=300641 RepID=A0AAV2TF42_CALDB